MNKAHKVIVLCFAWCIYFSTTVAGEDVPGAGEDNVGPGKCPRRSVVRIKTNETARTTIKDDNTSEEENQLRKKIKNLEGAVAKKINQ